MSTATQVFEAIAPTFTRPNDTTAYTAGDQVANSTTAGSVTPLAFVLPARRNKIYGARITKSTASPTVATFKLHLYGSLPTVAAGDNAAWSTSSSNYLGNVTVDMTANTFTNTNTAPSTYSTTAPIVFVATSNTIYGLLVATGAYAPGAQETFSVSIQGESSD